MKNLKHKVMAAVLMVSSLVVVSTSVKAEEASVEKVIAQVVYNQGVRVMNDLSSQIQQSIKQELSLFSIDYSDFWTTDEQQVLAEKNSNTKNTVSTQSSTEE